MLSYQKNATLLAAKILKESGADRRLSEGYTRIDPAWIAAKAGVMVMRRPLQKLLGAFVREATSGIILNSQRPTGQTHLTCAHELGHFFLGHESTADERIQYKPGAAMVELEADWFAYSLLTSRLTVSLAMRRKAWSINAVRNPLNLYQLSLRLGVSYSAMAWSLARLGLWANSDAERLQQIEPSEIKRAILGRGNFDPRADVWLLDNNDRNLILEPAENDQVVLQLPNNAAAGYLWSMDEARSEGFQVRPITNAAQAELAPNAFQGNGTTHHLMVRPADRAELTGRLLPIAVEERRPWETQPNETDQYVTALGFEASGEGLTTASKRLLVEGAAAQ